MKVAIVGSGVSGLVAAWNLSKSHQVTLYEANSRLGGHANTVRVDVNPSPLWIDTGFIVHNDRNYPILTDLFKELGVATTPSNMSFSVSSPSTDVYYRATNLASLFAHRPNLGNKEFLKMLYEIHKFNKVGRELLSTSSKDVTTKEFVESLQMSDFFLTHYLIPLGASIWSADPGTFLEFPAESLLRFLDNHGLISLGNRPQWKTIVGGSVQYVAKIASGLEERGGEILLDAAVTDITRAEASVTVSSAAGTHTYDKAIIATHSDQALQMLSTPTALESELLGSIAYQPNSATLHTDTSLMPPNMKNWAAWNYSHNATDQDLATLTYDLTLLQGLGTKKRYLVSLNSDHAIDPATILAQSNYAHPVFDMAALRAQRRYGELIKASTATNTYFVGAYWHYGFHEDGAKSAMQVVEAIEQNT